MTTIKRGFLVVVCDFGCSAGTAGWVVPVVSVEDPAATDGWDGVAAAVASAATTDTSCSAGAGATGSAGVTVAGGVVSGLGWLSITVLL
jgi:hypothetical protein